MRIAFISRLEDYEKGETPLGVAHVSAMVKREFPGVQTIWRVALESINDAFA